LKDAGSGPAGARFFQHEPFPCNFNCNSSRPDKRIAIPTGVINKKKTDPRTIGLTTLPINIPISIHNLLKGSKLLGEITVNKNVISVKVAKKKNAGINELK